MDEGDFPAVKGFARLGPPSIDLADRQAVGRRRAARRHAQVSAKIQSAVAGKAAMATIVDISTNGCCLTAAVDWLRTGGFITIKLERDEPVQAIVRWVRGDSAGVEFLRPLSFEQVAWRKVIDQQDSW